MRNTLDQLEKDDILAKVTEPTLWVSSMVVVPEKDGSLRLCLDPKDLNRAEQREHYPLPVIEDVAVRFHKARLFTVLDVRQGFWHIVLSQESSYLTCELRGRTLLVIVDYYSGYIEVDSLKQTTSRSVIKSMKQMFSRYGTPDILVTDNGPQYASEEFARFATEWQSEHVTSSPGCPRSNGRAENAVKTVKRLFTKCREDGTSEFQALLDWRNTPTEGVGTSPAQRLMGRRCKTLLPTTDTLLKPQYDINSDTQALRKKKEESRRRYNCGARPLSPLKSRDTVRMKLPGQTIWTPDSCHSDHMKLQRMAQLIVATEETCC